MNMFSIQQHNVSDMLLWFVMQPLLTKHPYLLLHLVLFLPFTTRCMRYFRELLFFFFFSSHTSTDRFLNAGIYEHYNVGLNLSYFKLHQNPRKHSHVHIVIYRMRIKITFTFTTTPFVLATDRAFYTVKTWKINKVKPKRSIKVRYNDFSYI